MPTKCKRCGNTLLDNAQFCSQCGAKVGQTMKTRTPKLIIIVIVVISFTILGIVIGVSIDQNNVRESVKEEAQSTEANDIGKAETVDTESEIVNIWIKKSYVDAFGDETEDKFVTNIKPFIGRFSNSATTNANLSVIFAVDSRAFSILLYEYDSHLVKGSANYPDEYIIKVKTPAGRIKVFEGVNTSDRIVLTNANASNFASLIRRNESLKIVIINKKYETTNYQFDILDTTGFTDNYNDVVFGS